MQAFVLTYMGMKLILNKYKNYIVVTLKTYMLCIKRIKTTLFVKVCFHLNYS